MSGNEDKKDLAVPEPTMLAIPMMPIDELKELTAYVNTVKKTLMIKGQDYVIEGNRQFTARSGFAKLHQGFFLSDGHATIKTLYYDEPHEFEYTHRIRRDLKTEKITTKIYGFEAYVTVINVNTGRHASGEGACTLEELHQTNNMSPKWYHRCLGTAKTRAWNRAVSNYVGSAEVSAEEMGLKYTDDEPGVRAPSPPTKAREVPKEVKSEKRDIYPLPVTPLNTPHWDFTVMVRDKGWDEVETVIVAYLFDMGFMSPESAFEYGHDVAKAWVRNAPGVYFGDGMKEIDTVLQIAGFKYHGGEKRWRYAKPEKPVVDDEDEVSETVTPVTWPETQAVVESEPVVTVEEPDEEPEPTPKGDEGELKDTVTPAEDAGPDPSSLSSPGSEEAPTPEPSEKEPPQGPPRSVEDVIERIAAVLPGYKELIKITDRGDYYRIGRQKMLDREIEDHLDFHVSEMGGEWDNENNEWRISKEAEG